MVLSGADGRLTNNATQVVLMREGQRTVLSMQNGYQGPPQDFAMVVPVPVSFVPPQASAKGLLEGKSACGWPSLESGGSSDDPLA